MSRIKEVEYSEVKRENDNEFRSVKYIAIDGTEEFKTLKTVRVDLDEADLCDTEVSYSDMFVESVSLNVRLKRTTPIRFNGCVFSSNTDLNFHEVNCRISFNNCVFLDDFCLFGTFYEAVSFENVSFINSNVNSQECEFSHFVFRITTLINSHICFQQTQFWSENVYFDNMSLYNSIIDFANSDFSESSELLDMLCVKADEKSHIRFIMVDFDFDEFRLWHSDIECLKFIECTFNCRRFEFDCEVKTLIMQKCTNNGVLSLGAIKGLRDFNIIDFENNGRVSVGKSPQIFIDAIKTEAEIVWVRGHEYRAASVTEKNTEIHDIGNFYIPNQMTQTERLCFGVFAKRLMESMQTPYNKQRALVELLLSMITNLSNVTDRRGKPIPITDKMASELLNFKTDVRIEIQNRAAQPDMVNVAYANFEEEVYPSTKKPLREDLLLDIKNLVQEDNDARNNKVLLNNFDKPAKFLADVFLYALQKPNKRVE